MITENNRIVLVGEIVSDFQFSHEIRGEGFYLFDLKVNRFSENFDVLPVMISERIVNVKQSGIGATVKVDGQLRSYNEYTGGISHRILSVFVNAIENVDEGWFENGITLQGLICKGPIYRKTPTGKDICDFTLVANRPYGKKDYIPCIAWGRDAIFMGTKEIGTEVKIEGRFQSREYTKKLESGESEIRTAFEVSVQSLEVVNDECEN